MPMESIADLLNLVRKAGEMALREQQKISCEDRSYKDDDSVVTPVDRSVEDYLSKHIAVLYPQADILTEEASRPLHPGKEFTFVIDPIDGTDVFSQGLPGWCISVGLLDVRWTPMAGIVFSPPMDLLLFADLGCRATRNGIELPFLKPPEGLSRRTNLMVSSRIHKELDLSGYMGKIRSIGSSALHLCFPLIYTGIAGAVESSGIRIWDIAGAHAINLVQGLAFELLDGASLDYRAMADGSPAGDVILAGSRNCVLDMKRVLRKFSGGLA